MEYKSLAHIKEVKQVGGVGEVSFYFLRFDRPDSDGDTYDNDLVIDFDENRIRWFVNHDPHKVLGNIEKIDRDELGAYAVCKIPIVGSLEEFYELYKVGAIKEHSFGFEVLDYVGNDFGGRHIKSLRLWEVSTITSWAAQANANTISIKSDKFATMENMEEKVLKAISGMKLEAKLSEQEAQAVQTALSGIQTLQQSMIDTQQAMSDGLRQVSDTLTGLLQQPQQETSGTVLDTEAKHEFFKLAQYKRSDKLSGYIKAPSLSKLIKKGVAAATIPGNNVTQLRGTAINWANWSGLPTAYGSVLFDIATTLSISGHSFRYADATPVSLTTSSGTGFCYTPAEINLSLTAVDQTLRRYATIMTVCSNIFEEYSLVEQSLREMMRELVSANIEGDYATLLLGSPAFAPIPYAGLITAPNIWDLAHIIAHDIRINSANRFTPDVVIVSPITALRMQSLKDTTNQYLLGNRPDFGLQIVATTRLTNTQMVVGDSSTLFWVEQEGRGTELSVSYENRDHFERDLITLRLTTVGLPFRRAAHVGAWRVVANINATLGLL